LVTPVTAATSYTVEVSTGILNCYNVSLNLNFCKNYLASNQLYNVRDVATAESIAKSEFNAFSVIYNNTCGESLMQFVCKYNFQACDGDGLTKRLCFDDCQTITKVCGANACVDPVCSEFTTCSNPVTTQPPNSATSLISCVMFLLIILMVVSL